MHSLLDITSHCTCASSSYYYYYYCLCFLSVCLLFQSGLVVDSGRLISRQTIFRTYYFNRFRDSSISRQTQLLLSASPCRKIINTFTLTDKVKLPQFTAFHGSDNSKATLLIMKYYIFSFNSFYRSRCCKRKLPTCLLISILINVKVLSCPTTEKHCFG